MKSIFTILFVFMSCLISGQAIDTTFFPEFVPYSETPIINFGDELFGSPWNDPTVLKEGDIYIMYTSGVQGGINYPADSISIYRWVSDDGYSWGLEPNFAVLEPLPGTYYSRGVETPSVVHFGGEYHMYNTVYTENDPYQFKISHATSTDGLSWQMDAEVFLEPTIDLDWMSLIVAEPGVMVKQDTLHLFFTASGPIGGQTIGLVRSIDGSSIIDTTLTVTLPTDVYPEGNNYAGLSTPSPAMVGDTIYLFTDVAQFVFGDNWMQVALHQFKSYGGINNWYHDTNPIHTRSDFSWTDGNYLAEIRSITALMDNNKLRIWYAGHNISEIDTITNDTLNHVFFIGDELHVETGYWGIGTSAYIFENSTGMDDSNDTNLPISIRFFENNGLVQLEKPGNATLNVYSINGQLLLEEKFADQIQFQVDFKGMVLINVICDEWVLTKKCYSF